MTDRTKDRTTTKPRAPDLALEKEQLALDRQKQELEHRKFELEEKKTALNLYLEDFKARWQELLNFESENNRWTTLYVTALLLVISWILNNGGKYGGLKGLYHDGDNAYFILAIAIVNALYTFAMAFKGYQIQQIAQYQYDYLGGKMFELIQAPFNE
jgi:magnesium-transporting ATPase (P-type)